MILLITILISFIAGFIITFPFLQNKTQQIDSLPPTTQTQTPSAISLNEPPTHSIEGSIISTKGTVTMRTRESTTAGMLRVSKKIYQGERIFTDTDSNATLSFPEHLTLSLDESSDLSLVQTLPYSFVFLQRAGTSIFTKHSSLPISIKFFNAALALEKGMTQLSIEPDKQRVDIEVSSGSATIGYNDKNFISQVFIIQEGQTATYDDVTRTTTIQ